ncbi:MAG TPA: hypothetical protein VF308_03840, partial [Caldimonas sp.]
NAVRNNLVTIALALDDFQRLRRALFGSGGDALPEVAPPIVIDMRDRTLAFGTEQRIEFEFDPVRQHMLIEGLDDCDYTAAYSAAIDAYESAGSALER